VSQTDAYDQDDPTDDDGPGDPSGDGSVDGAGQAPVLTLGPVQSQTAVMHDGTPGARISVQAKNETGRALDASELIMMLTCQSTSGANESDFQETWDSHSFAVGEERQVAGPVQLDPGDWAVALGVYSSATRELVTSSDWGSVHIDGHVAASHSFDDTQPLSLRVEINQVEWVQGVMFRVHYLAYNDSTQAVPPGLPVQGSIVQDSDTLAWQDYHLERGVAPNGHEQHYLTLEAEIPDGQETISGANAYITVDPNGPAQAYDAVQFSFDGHQVTMSR